MSAASYGKALGERLASLVREAADSDECETHRIRDYTCFREVRVSEEPGFGLRVEVDVALEDVTCDRVLPSNLDQSRVGEEALEMLNAGDDVTGFAEAIPENAFKQLTAHLAKGSDASLSAIRESIREFGYCSEVYRNPHDGAGVAIFSAFF